MDVLLPRGVGVAPPPAPFEWGPHQSHPFVHSCVHPVIQQLILTEQAHGPAPGWAPATLANPLMASASLGGGGPGGCFCPGWPRGCRAREQRTPALQARQAGWGARGGPGLAGWPLFNSNPGGGGGAWAANMPFSRARPQVPASPSGPLGLPPHAVAECSWLIWTPTPEVQD